MRINHGHATIALVPLAYLYFELARRYARLRAETGYDAWLRYAPLEVRAVIASTIAPAGGRSSHRRSPPHSDSAEEELIRGVRGMLGRVLRVETRAAGRCCDRPRNGDQSRPRSTDAGVRGWRSASLAADGFSSRLRDRDGQRIRCSSSARTIAACCTARSRCCEHRAAAADREPRRARGAVRADSHCEPLGQSRRHDRARLRRQVDLLGERPRHEDLAACATTPGCWRRWASTAARSTT